MKKIQVIVGILFLTLILFACQKEEPKLFHLSYGDTPSSIKSRIYLKTSLDDEDIIWTTSNSDVISSTGVVTRPQVDAQPIEVTLDAEYKGKNYSFEFIVLPLTGNQILDLYPGIEDEASIIEIIDYDQLVTLLQTKEQALIYLGFESCPWCQEYVPIFHKLAKNTGHEVIYYYNFREIRTVVEGSLNPLFQTIVDLIDEPYLVSHPTISTLQWLYAPTFIGLKDGIIQVLFTGAIDNHVASQSYLTSSQEETLKQYFRNLLSAVKPEDPCGC